LAQPAAGVMPKAKGPIHYLDTLIVPVAKDNKAVQPDSKKCLLSIMQV
jgi:hypothetical protein